MAIENNNEVHSKERLQYNKDAKTTAEKYAQHHKLDFSKCDSDKVEDVNERGKVKILEEYLIE